eukprot:365180-Chlamydomonas_euryale.AAC.13
MEGGPRESSDGRKLSAAAGVIPRAIKQIFDTIEQNNSDSNVKVCSRGDILQNRRGQTGSRVAGRTEHFAHSQPVQPQHRTGAGVHTSSLTRGHMRKRDASSSMRPLCDSMPSVQSAKCNM